MAIIVRQRKVTKEWKYLMKVEPVLLIRAFGAFSITCVEVRNRLISVSKISKGLELMTLKQA
jgi:hypothetical protein